MSLFGGGANFMAESSTGSSDVLCMIILHLDANKLSNLVRAGSVAFVLP